MIRNNLNFFLHIPCTPGCVAYLVAPYLGVLVILKCNILHAFFLVPTALVVPLSTLFAPCMTSFPVSLNPVPWGEREGERDPILLGSDLVQRDVHLV